MKKGGSKRKGSGFEREIAKELSLWWTDNERNDIFWLTSGSGARSTTRMKKGISTANSAGDLMALDPLGQELIDLFIFEIKRGYSSEINLLDFIESKKKPVLLRWWEKAEKEAEKSNRPNVMIIFKRNHKIPLVMISNGAIADLTRSSVDIYNYKDTENCGLFILKLEDLLKIPPKTLLEAYREEY